MSEAGPSLYFSGDREPLGGKPNERLLAHGIKLEDVWYGKGQSWRLPYCIEKMVERAERQKARLIVLDPITSFFMPNKNEKDAGDIRELMLAAAWVADVAKVAFLAIMHPGKEEDNHYRGSSDWKVVVRSALWLFQQDPPDGQRYIKQEKPSLLNYSPIYPFTLVSHVSGSATFNLGNELNVQEAARLTYRKGRGQRYAIDRCEDAIRMMLKDEDKSGKFMTKSLESMGFGRGVYYDAAARAGVAITPESGSGGDYDTTWALPRSE